MTQTVWPYLFYPDVEAAAEFLQRAFGFREVDRQVGAGGGTHLELETESGGRIYAGEMASEGRSGMVYMLVPDVDAHHERAKREGAEVFEELFVTPFGHRRYSCADPFGQWWSFATPVE
ncbi:MAG: VOC family protein [Gaiellaceae bacterium]